MPPLSKVFQSTWQHTYEVLISKNIGAKADKRLKFCPRFTLHFSFHPPNLSLSSSLIFSPALWWIVQFPPPLAIILYELAEFFTLLLAWDQWSTLGRERNIEPGQRDRQQTTSRSNLLPSNFDSRGGCVGYSLCNTLWGPKLVPCTVESTRLPLHDSLLTVRQTDIQSLVWMITLLLTMTLSFMCSWCERIHALFYGEKSQTNLLFQCH